MAMMYGYDPEIPQIQSQIKASIFQNFLKDACPRPLH